MPRRIRRPLPARHRRRPPRLRVTREALRQCVTYLKTFAYTEPGIVVTVAEVLAKVAAKKAPTRAALKG